MFVQPYFTLRAVRTQIGKPPVSLAAGLGPLGVTEVELETRPTDAMVGGTGAAGPAPDLRNQTPGGRIFCKKSWTRDLLSLSLSLSLFLSLSLSLYTYIN